jgi:tRNA threonylcarbamoyladenosine biosynthesis protein TsaE
MEQCKNYTMENVRITRSPAETYEVGRIIGQAAPPGLVIALTGDLGAGKTALTQGIAAGLGVGEPVTSPTFTLVNRYATARGIELVHIDAYRLGDTASTATREAATIGMEELLTDDQAIIVIEWAELLAELLPADHIAVRIEPLSEVDGARRLTFTAHGAVSATVLAALLPALPAATASPTK